MPEIVQIVFENRENPGTYGGKRFSYIADYPVSVGDVVTVPTKYGDRTACVCHVNVQPDKIGCEVEMLQHIEAPADEAESTDSGDLFDDFFN